VTNHKNIKWRIKNIIKETFKKGPLFSLDFKYYLQKSVGCFWMGDNAALIFTGKEECAINRSPIYVLTAIRMRGPKFPVFQRY
jgi:hypothetical protein